jgi:hypothetical protein
MEPNGLAAGSSDSTGGQTEALNQNRAHREHTLESRAVLPTILGTDSAVGTPGIGVGLEGWSGKCVSSARARAALTRHGRGKRARYRDLAHRRVCKHRLLGGRPGAEVLQRGDRRQLHLGNIFRAFMAVQFGGSGPGQSDAE